MNLQPEPHLATFKVTGLHGRSLMIDLRFEGNRLILVGENGTGKSTVANLFYYLLTQQWRRINEFKFASIEVEASMEVVRITKKDVEVLVQRHRDDIRHHFAVSNYARHSFEVLQEELFRLDVPEETALERISDVLRVPKSVAKRVFLEEATHRKLKKPLLEEVKKLQSWNFGQFLYLPTYRRIEQDLKSIFRGIEIEDKVREFRDRFKKKEESAYVELVEFGMEDVERTIQGRMAQIKENVRTGLSNMTGTYLREVIRGLQDSPNVSALASVDVDSFQAMFARIDDAILPPTDKSLLQAKIRDFSSGQAIGSDDKVIAHFVSKLVDLYRKQQENEKDVRDFVELCNGYMTGKHFVYNETQYDIYIQMDLTEGETKEESERLPLKVLSSGEKQIVSLFSHIYFSGQRRFFVVIDEPELSLSVPWQEKFLPDIMGTGRCSGLFAVTHSPFIWENDLESSVKSLAEHTRPI